MIKDLRYLCFELRPECNYTSRHPWCPSICRQHGTGPLITDDTIEKFILACQDRGFTGLVGFHFYSEPLLDIERILAFMERLPSARYVLWTNGSLLEASSRGWLPRFAQVSISLYGEFEAARIAPIIARLSNCVANPAPHDRRIDIYNTKTVNCGGCVRPAHVELPIDCWGDIHLCCTDYDNHIKIANIVTDEPHYCINMFEMLAREAELGMLSLCWACRSIHSPAIPK